jgi:cobalt/nickel transport system permease protein
LKNRFVEKTLWGLLRLMKESLFAEEIAGKKGLLQSLDPRVRALSLMGLLVSVLFVKSLSLLGALYLAAILLALASRISLPSFLARTWVFIPLFSLFIALPALTVWVSPGEVVCRIGPIPITRQGIGAAAFFVTRVADSVSYALLITLTTRHFELLKVLRIFGVPQIFVMILGMTYRYIHLFIGLLENMHRAVLSRVGSSLSPGKGRHLVAWNIAALWLRSHRSSEDVYRAMLSRGFKGEPVLLMDFKTSVRDWAFLAVLCLAVFMIFRMN